MILTKHKVEGFAGFNKPVEFSISREPSLVLGINGAGKTTLLNSVFASIEYCISKVQGANVKEIGVSTNAISFGSEFSNILSEFVLPNESSSKEIGFKLLHNGQTNLIGKDQRYIRSFYQEQHKNIESGILPVIRYFQSEKNIENNRDVVSNQRYNKIENRNVGYENYASKTILIHEVTSFLINQINIENQIKVDNHDFTSETKVGKYLRETLNKFTTVLYGQNIEVKVQPSKFSSGQSIVVNKNNHNLEFSQLSSGEKYILSLVLELIYRIVTLNPRVEDFQMVYGIVLIDEIENHLHPRWQLTIIRALKTCFPEFQFIVSSHSPLIASSVRKGQVIALSNFHRIPIEELPDVFTGTSDELLDKIFHSGIRVDNFQKEIKSIESLINQFRFEDAEKELEVLKLELGSNPQWLQDLVSKISFGKA